MNKILRASFAMLLIGSLVGCGTAKEEKVENETTTNNVTETPGNGNTANEGTTNNANGTNEHKLEVADHVATKITELDEVEKASVIVTNSNAYVAATLKAGVKEDKALETKIGDKAREADSNFKNVYVSLKPELVEKFTGYETKIRANEPVEGYFQEFTETVRGIFPHAE